MLGVWVSVVLAGNPPCGLDLLNEQAQRATVTLLEVQDFERFEAESSSMRETLGCVTEHLQPAGAAKVHRVLGLDALLEGDADGALDHFAAAEALDAHWSLPASWDSTQLEELVTQAADRTVWLEPPAESSAELHYDGQYSHRPANVATIAQIRGPSGTVRTYVLGAGETDLFVASLGQTRPSPIEPVLAPSASPPSTSRELLDLDAPPPVWRIASLVSGGALLTAGASTLVTYGAYQGADRDGARLDGLYRANHVLLGTTIGLGAVTAGCVAAAQVTGIW